MKRALLGIVLLAVSLAVATFTVESLAVAGNESSAAPASGTEYTQEEKEAGLWRGGKAVFSDIKALDIFIPAPYSRGYAPKQPVNYSHVLHVQKNNIECQYCHSGVTKSSFATIPALEVCMGCHANVKQDSAEIKKLKQHWDEGKPVEWEPVNNLPEHVQFNHQRHVKAGVGCQSCHGQVQKMEVVERVSSFKMGFCVSCHRENGASIDCGTCHY